MTLFFFVSRRPLTLGVIVLALAAGISCSPSTPPAGEGSGSDEKAPVSAVDAPAEPPRRLWTEVTLHEAVRAKNPDYTGNGEFNLTPDGLPVAIGLGKCKVSDISFLRGMPLQALDLLECPVKDLSPIQGMPLVELYLEKTPVENLSVLATLPTLQKLYLNDTPVKDLAPIRGLAQLQELYLVHTQVSDLGPVGGLSALQGLWLTGSPVSDLTPLKQSPLISLTVHQTKVQDLSPLAGTRLQRLHIGETAVKDLTPLGGLALTRLVFTPGRIEKGFDAVKAIPSLREIGTRFDDAEKDLASPAEFWSRPKP
ncbi:MAG: hypothetical protein WBE58_11640 [Verrucomicrobiales bacterium]|nr:hypothetical protein [Verrucomicrobiales bacterium]